MAKKQQVRESQVVRSKKLHIAEENSVPPDLIDDRVITGKDTWDYDDPEAIIDVSIIRVTEPPEGGIYGLGPPDWFYIVSQTVRSVPGGGQVVDVLLEIENKPGVAEYEVRITKPTGQI